MDGSRGLPALYVDIDFENAALNWVNAPSWT